MVGSKGYHACYVYIKKYHASSKKEGETATNLPFSRKGTKQKSVQRIGKATAGPSEVVSQNHRWCSPNTAIETSARGPVSPQNAVINNKELRF